MSTRQNQNGVTLVEVLVGIVLLAVICVSSLGFFAYAMGGIAREGNRRAALERARERLEQLMAADESALPSIDNGSVYWCTAAIPASACWTTTAGTQAVTVNDAARPMETAVQAVDDPAAGTTGKDVWELSVKVWFTPNADNDEFNRVYLRTLRAPV